MRQILSKYDWENTFHNFLNLTWIGCACSMGVNFFLLIFAVQFVESILYEFDWLFHCLLTYTIKCKIDGAKCKTRKNAPSYSGKQTRNDISEIFATNTSILFRNQISDVCTNQGELQIVLNNSNDSSKRF